MKRRQVLKEFLRRRKELRGEAKKELAAFIQDLKDQPENQNKTIIEIIFENWDEILELILLLVDLFT